MCGTNQASAAYLLVRLHEDRRTHELGHNIKDLDEQALERRAHNVVHRSCCELHNAAFVGVWCISCRCRASTHIHTRKRDVRSIKAGMWAALRTKNELHESINGKPLVWKYMYGMPK